MQRAQDYVLGQASYYCCRNYNVALQERMPALTFGYLFVKKKVRSPSGKTKLSAAAGASLLWATKEAKLSACNFSV